jgi:hypothetical protein
MLAISSLLFAMRFPFSIFCFHWSLIIENSLKIDNCKLIIEQRRCV